jgi:hypothetical protein
LETRSAITCRIGCRTQELYLLGDLPRTFVECAQVLINAAFTGEVKQLLQIDG